MQFLKARQTKYAAYATVYILVVLAIMVVANILGDRYNKSYDGTANKRYSLSDQTVKIGARKEEAKSTTEEGITGAFIRDLKNNTRTVCFVSGSGEHPIDDSDRN